MQSRESVVEVFDNKNQIEVKEVSAKGSLTSAVISSSAITFVSLSPMVIFGAPLATMNQLDEVLKAMLASSTLVAATLGPIPATLSIEKTGGKKAALIAQGATLSGMTALTLVTATTSIANINGFDLRYGTMLGAGLLIGSGANTFPLFINTCTFAKSESQLALLRASYGAIVDVSNLVTPLVMHGSQSLGLVFPMSLYTGLLALSVAATIKFHHPAPYLQYREHFSHEVAKEKAKAFGQLEKFIQEFKETSWNQITKETFQALFDRRAIALNTEFFISLGNFIFSGTFLPTMLMKGFNMSEAEAIYASVISNGGSLLARVIAGRLIKWDKTKGVNVYLLGTAMTLAGAIPFAFSNLPRPVVYGGLMLANAGLGVGVATAINLADVWANPKNPRIEKCNPAIMFGLLGTLGPSGGIVLPLVMASLAKEFGFAAYEYYFLMMAGLLLLSSALTWGVHQTVMQENPRYFGKSINFFPKSSGRVIELSDLDVEILPETPDSSSLSVRKK